MILNQEFPTSLFSVSSDQKTLKPFEHNSCQIGFTICSSELEKANENVIFKWISHGEVPLIADRVTQIFWTRLELFSLTTQDAPQEFYALKLKNAIRKLLFL